jgi:cysteine desulfurase family protein
MIYLDNAATTSYKPPAVINAVKNSLKYLSANPGRGGHSAAMKAAYLINNTRDRVSNFFGCENPDLCFFTHNCTDSLNIAINGSARAGHVITTANEHNSVLRPLFEMERRKMIKLTVLAPDAAGTITPRMVKEHLRPDTYLVCVNHVSNVTGAASPVGDIGKITRPRRILFLVDSAQSGGHFRIDMKSMNIDMLAAAGHKGLHGPQGVGALLISPDAAAVLKPTRYGGTGTDSANVYHPSTPPEAFESGTAATPAIAGLNAAIRYTEKNFERNALKMNALTELLINELNAIPNIKVYTPPLSRSGVVSFNLPCLNSVDVCNILNEEYGICARGGLHCAPLIHKHLDTLQRGAVRISVSPENDEKEIGYLIKALSEML